VREEKRDDEEENAHDVTIVGAAAGRPACFSFFVSSEDSILGVESTKERRSSGTGKLE
jgi:hypothetical protein